jgi:TDG/mug DNA glycosylase family protein
MSLSLPDVIAPDLSVVFCGINPGMRAAAAGHHFVGRGNRFWRVMHLAGFTPHQLDAERDRTLLEYRCGLTTAVARATVGASELSRHDFIAASAHLEAKIARYAPRVIAFLGKAAYSAIVGQRDVPWGVQSAPFGGSIVWVLPNPSGLNRTFSLAELVDAYHQLYRAVT